jgi:phage antirepressor YoqD-like protein|nr:MAG TPA: KilA protein [Caudoviricetes sp.]
MDIQIFEYNGNNISFGKEGNVMVNATEMAKPFGKRCNDFLSTKQTNELIDSLSAKTGIPATGLVTVNQGGNNQGTWMHEDLALIFAQWLSPDFYLWCNDRIKELLQYGMTATQPTLEQMINNPDLVISLATQLKNERDEKQRLQAQAEQQQVTIELQENEIKKSAPKVNYYDETLQSVNTMTTTQVAKEVGMEAFTLNKILKEKGIIYKQSGQWMFCTPYSRWGLHSTRTQTFTRSDGSIGTSVYTVWTQKGRRLVHALYDNNWNIRKAVKQIKGE